MKNFKLLIPGSTSNIGPGFDTLGIAIGIYNRLTVEPGGEGVRVSFESGVPDMFRKRLLSMVRSTVNAFLQRTGLPSPSASLKFDNDVPIARGLGSSSTFRMGTLAAMNRLAGEPIGIDDLLNIGCVLEKHTENCVAGSLGGLSASGFIGGKVSYARYELKKEMTFVTAVPDRPVSTAETRKLLPRRVNMKDAVANLNRTAILIRALSLGELDRLDPLLEDRFHQPYRAKIITPLFKVIVAARQAGAKGAFLSGSGSTIIAIAAENTERIGKAMKKVLDSSGWPCEVRMLKADLGGIREVNK